MQKKKIYIILGLIIFVSLLAVITVRVFFLPKQPAATAPLKTAQKNSYLYGIVINDLTVIQQEVQDRETFSDLFQKYGVTMQTVDKIVKYSNDIFDFRTLRSGNHYTAILSKDSSILHYLVYESNLTSYVIFDLKDSIRVYKGEKKVTKKDFTKEGVIESSLWNAMINIGSSAQLAMDLSDIYQWSIDFFGLQKGDKFKVYYTELFVDTTSVGIERIYAARFDHDGKTYMAYYFPEDSTINYYDEKGSNLKKAFLKAPLKFSRISSKFSNSRLHPVLKIRRPHHGVDYAAPAGTPVQSIGNGIVISKSYAGGAGHMVKIQHNNGFESAYLHLSKYGEGIAKGSRISQGQIIGYVGSTGLSTGPHLDFRVYKNGTAVDPLKLISPPSDPIKDANRDAFKKIVEEMNKKLSI